MRTPVMTREWMDGMGACRHAGPVSRSNAVNTRRIHEGLRSELTSALVE